MKVILLVAVFAAYYFNRGYLLEWIGSRYSGDGIDRSQRMGILVSGMDLMFSLNGAGLLLNVEFPWMIAGNLVLLGLIKSRLEGLERETRRRVRRALVHLLMSAHYGLSTGDRFETVIEGITDNLIVDALYSLNGCLETRMLMLGQKIDDIQYNKLVSLVRRMNYFDGPLLIDELDQLVSQTLRAEYEEGRQIAEKFGEWMIAPMVLNLVNMTAMIVYPYMRDWYR